MQAIGSAPSLLAQPAQQTRLRTLRRYREKSPAANPSTSAAAICSCPRRTTRPSGRTRSPSRATTTACPLPDTYAVALGTNWRHNFDRYLHIINPSAIYGVTAERETGQYVSFSSSSGTYTTDSDLDYTLTKSGSTWTLTDPDDTVETYSQSGAEATLQQHQAAQRLHADHALYERAGFRPSSDTYGRTLGLSYTSRAC